MAQLVADNDKYPHIQWTTPVSQLIPEDFVLADEHATQHTTIEDTLSHRTGLPRHDQAYGNNNMSRDIAVREIVRSLRHLPLTAEPRTKFQYCNLMFVVASHVIQSVTGEWLGDLLAAKIWEPLGMKATFFSLQDAQAADEELARGYSYPYSDDDDDDSDEGGDEKEFREVEWMNLNEVSGAGSVITNVLDYAKWARSLLYKAPPLSPEIHKAIWEPRTLLPTDAEGPFTGPVAYALGWNTGVYQGYQFYEHTGGMNAFGAELILFPELKYAVTILGNTAVTSNFAAKQLAFHLIDEKLGVPPKRRFDWDR
jgi:CubicO group peptidase (beta-lactamase class C family)